MDIIHGKNINQIIFKVLEKVTTEGYRTSSRNGDVLSLYDISLILENPGSRHLNLVGRTNNIFATFAETFWVLSGDSKISPFLSFFVPRAPKYSDDKAHWRAAYGERIYEYGQLENIVEIFKEEGIFTRRAVISLFFPNKDTKESLKKEYNLTKTLDIPCNNWVNFFITPDKKLNMKVTQRSGDVIFGISNINLFQFSVLLEMLLYVLKKEVDSSLTLGYHHHSVTNLHLYDFNGKQGYKILKEKLNQQLGRLNENSTFFAESISKNKQFFQILVSKYTDLIISEELPQNFEASINIFRTEFKRFNIQIESNPLWAYTIAILAYIYQEKFEEQVTLDLSGFSDELIYSLANNRFTKKITIKNIGH